jgi:hypothetical protein
LKNLKTLKFDEIIGTEIEINNFLSLLQNDSVKKLKISGRRINLCQLTIKQLVVILPRLSYIDITSQSSINILNAILEKFPNLEVLKFVAKNTDEAFIFQNGLKHNKLKSLELEMPNSDDVELLKLINSCKNLENLDISTSNRKLPLLEQIKAPNLKSLTLRSCFGTVNHPYVDSIDSEFIAAFKEHCKNLNFFRWNSCTFGIGVTLEMIQEEFKEMFTSVKIRNNLQIINLQYYIWEMKKL